MRLPDLKIPRTILIASMPILALLISHIVWGATPVIAKISLNEFPMMTLAFLRFFLAFLLLLPFLWISKKEVKLKTEDLPKILGIGLLMVTFHIFFFFSALQKTTAINASVLSLTVPIFSVIVGWTLLREKVYVINIVGIILGAIGAIIVIGLPLIFLGNLTSSVLIGNILMILSSLSFVGGAILSKFMLKRYSPLLIVASSFLIGAISFLPLALIEQFKNPAWYHQLTIIGIFGLMYLTLLSSICAYFLFEWGVEKVGVIRADLIQYIQPSIAASLAVPILHERISYSFIVGTCLIVLGVYWGTLGKSEHHHHHFKHHRV